MSFNLTANIIDIIFVVNSVFNENILKIETIIGSLKFSNYFA